jgi:hypothetical protein
VSTDLSTGRDPTADQRLALALAARRRAARGVRRNVVAVFRVVGGWFWAIFTAVNVVVPLLVSRAGGDMEQSVFQSSAGTPRWFAFVLGIIVLAAVLTLHLAAGGTRTAFTTGLVGGAALVGLAFGALTVALMTVERLLYPALGLEWSRDGGLVVGEPVLVDALVTFVAESLGVATYVLVGAAIAAGYRRHGVRTGTLLILPLLVPLALTDLATRGGVGGLVLTNVAPLDGGATAGSVVLGLAGGVLGLALAAAVLHLLVRGVRLRPST